LLDEYTPCRGEGKAAGTTSPREAIKAMGASIAGSAIIVTEGTL
jgi:hypothetical protein